MQNIENISQRESAFSKVVGDNITTERKKEILKEMADKFEKRLALERPYCEKIKTKEEIEVIEGINKYLPEFIAQYGGAYLPTDQQDIYFLDGAKFTRKEKKILAQTMKKREDAVGFYSPMNQEIVFLKWYNEHPLEKARLIAHELLHFQSFQALTEHNNNLRTRQMGISFETPGASNSFFADLNEAVTEWLAILFAKRYFKKIDCLREEAIELETFNAKFPDEKIYDEVASIYRKKTEGGQWKTEVISYRSHPESLKKLDNLMNKIYQKNKERFQTQGDVFNIFARAAMTGDISEMAKLIEVSLGKGAFKKVAKEFNVTHENNETQDRDSSGVTSE